MDEGSRLGFGAGLLLVNVAPDPSRVHSWREGDKMASVNHKASVSDPAEIPVCKLEAFSFRITFYSRKDKTLSIGLPRERVSVIRRHAVTSHSLFAWVSAAIFCLAQIPRSSPEADYLSEEDELSRLEDQRLCTDAMQIVSPKT